MFTLIPSLDLALYYPPSQTAIHEQSDGYGILLSLARYRSIQVLAPVEFYLDREGAVLNSATEKNSSFDKRRYVEFDERGGYVDQYVTRCPHR